MTAETVGPTGAITTAPSRRVCCRDLPRGKCRSEVTGAEAAQWQMNERLLDDLVHFAQPHVQAAGEPSHPALYRLIRKPGGQPEDLSTEEPMLMLLASAMLRPVTPAFQWFRPAHVDVGERAFPGSGFASPAALLARMEAGTPEGFVVQRLAYKWITGLELEVLGVDDVTAAVRSKTDAPGRRPAHEDVFRHLLGKDKGKKARPRQQPRAGPLQRRAAPGGQDAAGPLSDKGSDGEGPGQEHHQQADGSEAASAMDVAVAFEAAPGSASADEVMLEEEEPPSEAQALAALPRWDTATWQVYDGERIIGRVKPMHAGTTWEAVSEYCRLHGCQPPLRRASPSLYRCTSASLRCSRSKLLSSVPPRVVLLKQHGMYHIQIVFEHLSQSVPSP